jgi:hypothetical protein
MRDAVLQSVNRFSSPRASISSKIKSPGVLDKENENPQTQQITSRPKKMKRQSLGRRVSFSSTVDVRTFYKPTVEHPSTSSPPNTSDIKASGNDVSMEIEQQTATFSIPSGDNIGRDSLIGPSLAELLLSYEK